MKTNAKLLALATVFMALASFLSLASEADAFDGVASPTFEQSGNAPGSFSATFTGGGSNWSKWDVYFSGSLVGEVITSYDINMGNPPQVLATYGQLQLITTQVVQNYYWPQPAPFPIYFLHNTENGLNLKLDSPNELIFNTSIVRYDPTHEFGKVLKYYQIDLSTMTLATDPYLYTLAPTIDTSATSIWETAWDWLTNSTPPTDFVPPASQPLVFTYKDGSKAWIYRGTDGNDYTFQIGENGKFILNLTSADVLPTIIPFQGNNSFFISNQSAGSGSYLVSNHQNRLFTKRGPFESGINFKSVTAIENPMVYLKATDNQIYSWDMNCNDPAYSSCRFNFTEQAKYCADNGGVFDPRNIPCGTPVSLDLTGMSSGSGSSGSSGSSSSTGSVSIGYEQTPQNCTPVSFSGATTLTDITEDLQPLSCSWRTFSGSYMCQDLAGHACVTSGDACLQQIYNPSQYTGSGSSTTTTVTKYNCISATATCTWSDKDTCSTPSSNSCQAEGDYCRVKPTLKTTGIPSVSSSVFDNSFTSTGRITKTVGTTPDIVYSSGSTQYCDLFDDNNNFLYRNTGLVTLQTDFTTLVDNDIVKIPLGWMNRVQDFVTRPLNILLGLGSSFLAPDDGQKVCIFGTVATVEYQSFLKLANGTQNTIGPFKDAPALNFDGNTRTVVDYFVIFFFVIIAGSLVAILHSIANVKQ